MNPIPVNLTFEDFVRSGNEWMMSILRSWQEASIDGLNAWMKSIAPLVPDFNLYHEMPTFLQDALGDPDAILDDVFSFAVGVLELQRGFIHAVYRASLISPRTPFVPPDISD